ncbi:histone deacetylase [Actinomadura rayongensis]|uniref:Histone deacetylase n=1 Tax=Actinomadura rayongensis TaxID=1429076 RepID=A0A6I4WE56_9ACTN|nr:histone deacetylase [Actinomadura rayongensis]MXQ67343.1 histone deacetylase [Actinomadura rayongensis]
MKLWYAAYGSNLYRRRFGCYIAGGRPPGGAVTYSGCRDPRPAAADRALTLPGGIYFAHTSPTWGGGIAFYDPELPGRAAARAYLLTAGQFSDVVAQEMHRPAGADLDLTEVLATGRQTLGPGHYETVLLVGEHEGDPVLTFTAPHPLDDVEVRTPTGAYLAMLGHGLREAHDWDAARAGAYLATRPGAAGTWTARDVEALLTVPVPTDDDGVPSAP